METSEWALILFTVLAQASIGAFLLLTWLRQRNQEPGRDPVYRKSVAVLVALAAVALLASLFHLGRPALALTALRNLGTSWLSREIFFTGGFFVLLVASQLLESRPGLRRAVDWLAALAGVLAVISMAAVYSTTMRPAWQGWGTYVAFAGTAVLMGLGLTAGLLTFFGRTEGGMSSDVQQLTALAVVALVAGLVAYPLYLASLGTGGPEAQASLQLLGSRYAALLAVRWALTLVGGAVPLVLTWRRLAAGAAAAGLVYTAAVSLLAGELVGRYLFYATGVQIGIG
ncbi:anaerobic dimethyl sulfoxide reductase subunit C (anchor subunit) [Symbiobacterium terraclitae]|uniref:Anaerobic dimethyl sulfoxide reductase subunit C (Anchor subunit) n=1 Tax=Symbiobacterium terraclitae TaxID=557451 RepID=A0ABS4JV58_9FIRM|nr:DmsC/YnfH family molybdoenzyme membrane anchor subunit [Symbiobacterium terraclitae]MBP2019438.1 anaerobic dimethyl sulfoxide reductase subunit C (anchor subunit) [Symbiobacterium terraclitae]